MPRIHIANDKYANADLPMFSKKRNHCVGLLHMKFPQETDAADPSQWPKYVLRIDLNVEHDKNYMITCKNAVNDRTVQQHLSNLSVIQIAEDQLAFNTNSILGSVLVWSPCTDTIGKWCEALGLLISVAAEREGALREQAKQLKESRARRDQQTDVGESDEVAGDEDELETDE